ncbi:hypothetical protein RBH29_02860 [Herbivorax sp. ANBcel31]|uniref:CIS tube protein n=1 Tax=Herbivorax sp. ANBcel31 TaxID=3069754 RepID=UPI0027B384A2|nr:hypothetical protein [Herbivorax sp. ANBcel31]MDQ2085379.1 hypothetical protein [Herbivorax sp. ANBcel31]
MGLDKAKIYYEKDNETKEIEVHFNPSEYTISAGNEIGFTPITGTNENVAQFNAGNVRQLDMDLHFDTYKKYILESKENKDAKCEDVREKTDKITDLLNVEPTTHRPPLCHFVWGSLNFAGYLESADQNFTMFMSDGKPVRAKLKVVFKEVTVEESSNSKEKPLESPDRTKQRILKGSDQLWTLSNEEYDDPAMWRVIANENKILNPRKVKSGMVFKLPSIN